MQGPLHRMKQNKIIIPEIEEMQQSVKNAIKKHPSDHGEIANAHQWCIKNMAKFEAGSQEWLASINLMDSISAAVSLKTAAPLASDMCALFSKFSDLDVVTIAFAVSKKNTADEQSLTTAWDIDAILVDASDSKGNCYLEDIEIEVMPAPGKRFYTAFNNPAEIARALAPSKSATSVQVTMNRNVYNSLITDKAIDAEFCDEIRVLMEIGGPHVSDLLGRLYGQSHPNIEKKYAGQQHSLRAECRG